MLLLTLYFLLIGIGVIYIDIKEKRIPNGLSISYLVGLAIYIAVYNPSLIDIGGGIFLGMCILFLCYYLTKGGVGEGDIKMCFSLCALVGMEGSLYFLLLASLLSLPVGIFFLIRKKGRTYAFPFGPFLVISFLVVWSVKTKWFHLLK